MGTGVTGKRPLSRRIILWFRGKDLRLHDHPCLKALTDQDEVIPIFVLDPYFFDPAKAREIPHRIQFLIQSLAELQGNIQARGSTLITLKGRSDEVIQKYVEQFKADEVWAVRWIEPFATKRDKKIANQLTERGKRLRLFEGETLFTPGSIRNGSGEMFRVFTPFSKVCWAQGPQIDIREAPARFPKLPQDVPSTSDPIPSMEDLGIVPNPEIQKGGEASAHKLLKEFTQQALSAYDGDRDRMDLNGTSRLSAHLKFGTISIQYVWKTVHDLGITVSSRRYLNELLWREFSHHLLWEWPHIIDQPFRSEFGGFPYLERENYWSAWTKGKTGYPIVDAAARELVTTGFVHNRARMISASFLTKHLLMDYRLGESHFMKYLTDGDWAQNNAGWQWSAGCGCDAQPWFRIFNPLTQSLKFDPQGEYIKRHIPELRGLSSEWIHTPWLAPENIKKTIDYPDPIVPLDVGRERFLETAKQFLASKKK